MCGIFGKFLFNDALPLSASIQALTSIKHRGPDGFGYEYGSLTTGDYTLLYNEQLSPHHKISHCNYFLGHRRLSIVDLNDNAYQPMESLDKRYSIVFNGEIYNYIELKDELTALGCQFKTDHSDTEALLNAYIMWGDKCLEKLRGMFAFAIFDRHNKTLFLARDRIGKKPLYYEISHHHLSFCSELSPLVIDDEPRAISKEALNAYLAFGYVPHPYSIFEGINKLPPAHFATIDLTTQAIEIKSYWDISGSIDHTLTKKEAAHLTETALDESVALRLRADVSIGAFVSGGIDSSLVVKKISEVGDRTFDIYGADFPNTDRSEKVYIEEVAEKYAQNLTLLDIDMAQLTDIDAIISVFDEPFAGASSIAVFNLFKEVRKKHKVILTGDGGDEMFAGYGRYLRIVDKLFLLRKIKRLVLPEIAISLLLMLGLKNERLLKLKAMLSLDLIDNYVLHDSDQTLSELLKPPFKIKALTHVLEPYKQIRQTIKNKQFSTTKALQYIDLKTILPGRMLYKIDRFSMFYGVEARAPFLDHKLAEKAFSIPDKITMEGGVLKRLLKDLLEKDFSADFVHRKKQGFGSPLSNWFKNAQSEQVFAVLIDEQSLIYHYINYQSTHNAFPQIKGTYQGSEEKNLWSLLVLALFLEKYKHQIKY